MSNNDRKEQSYMGWNDIFVGREKEIEKLKQIWERVKSGEPQLAVILGESGLGKTRLVQEFYTSLSQDLDQDPDGYWPPKLFKNGHLSCNPDAKKIDTKIDIPWLWWGMDFTVNKDQSPGNYVTSPFIQEDESLVVHADPIIRKRKVKSATRTAAKSFVSIFADLAGFGFVGLAIDVKEMIDARAEEKNCKETSTEQLLARRAEALANKTITVLRELLDKQSKDVPTIPVILFLDAAHWIDRETAISLPLLFGQALGDKRNAAWSLMIIATHWEKEWNEYSPTWGSGEFKHLKDTFGYYTNIDSRNCNLIRIEKLTPQELSPVVDSALPGISSYEKQFLVKEADGNPLVINEMVLELRDSANEYFEKGNLEGRLTRKGKLCLNHFQGIPLYVLIQRRFKKLDHDIKEALETGALYGCYFLRPMVEDVLTQDLITGYKADNIKLENAVQNAEEVHVLLTKVSSFGHRFQQNFYRKAALSSLEMDRDSYEERDRLVDKVIDDWLQTDRFTTLEDDDQKQLCELALGRYLANPHKRNVNHSIRGQAFSWLISRAANNLDELGAVHWWSRLLAVEENLDDQFIISLITVVHGALLSLDYSLLQSDKLISLVEKLIDILDRSPSDNNNLCKHIFLDYKGDICEISNTQNTNHVLQIRSQVIDYWRDQIHKSDDTYDSLLALSKALDKKAYLLKLDYSNNERSYILFKESYSIRQKLIERYGENELILQLLADSCEYLSSVNIEHGKNNDDALAYSKNSVEINRKVIVGFGETESRLLRLSNSLQQLGYIFSYYPDCVENAKNYYKESINTREKIIENYGESPIRIHVLALLYVTAGEFSKKVNDTQTACKYLLKAKDVTLTAIDNFGETHGLLDAITRIEGLIDKFHLSND